MNGSLGLWTPAARRKRKLLGLDRQEPPIQLPDPKLEEHLVEPIKQQQEAIARSKKKSYKVELDLWGGNAADVLPKITVESYGLSFEGSREEFERLRSRLNPNF